MINVIVPVIEQADEYSKSIAALSLRSDVKIFVGAVEELEGRLDLPKSAVLTLYKTGSKKEEIINSLKEYISDGKVVICRRPFSRKEFDAIAESKANVTFFERPKKNRFVEACKRIIGKMIKALFGVALFDGDISLIGFNEDMSEVLQNVNSLSYSSRVNRWRGVEINKVEGEREEVKLESSKGKNAKLLIFAILSLIVPIVITIVVALFAKVNFIIGMLLFCINALGLAGLILLLCMLYFNIKSGQRFFENAKEAR